MGGRRGRGGRYLAFGFGVDFPHCGRRRGVQGLSVEGQLQSRAGHCQSAEVEVGLDAGVVRDVTSCSTARSMEQGEQGTEVGRLDRSAIDKGTKCQDLLEYGTVGVLRRVCTMG